MPSTRTQVYLTSQQRSQIAEITSREGLTLAEVVRRALDEYLADTVADTQANLDATFGVESQLVVPDRDEWQRG